MKKNELKLLAVIGGSVVVMLGVLGVALGQEQASPGSVASSGMSDRRHRYRNPPTDGT